MKLQFKCTLKSDIIINMKSATEGQNRTLSFIPGNNFLGIIAKDYEKFSSEDAFEIFHSGNVRFGDAHPAFIQNNKIIRTHKIPASFYYPKSKTIYDKCYVHHFYDRSKDKENDGHPQQLKQARDGFFAFLENGNAIEMPIIKYFSQKSAFDSIERRSADEMMYGFESIANGTIFVFEIELDNASLADKITNSIIGIKHLGKSKSAEYGYVEIEKCNFQDYNQEIINTNEIAIVYADSRLIFIDKDSLLPTFIPTAKDLGFQDNDSEIDWELSQIRTFKYSPWNSKRNTRDAERAGIEKGSVFIVKSKAPISGSRYIGYYRNEGFGKVIYNPSFLTQVKENGVSVFNFQKENTSHEESITTCNSLLFQYLHRKKEEDDCNKRIFEEVNRFIEKNKKIFKGTTFASQWGKIRSIAQQNSSESKIIDELFDKVKIEKLSKTKTKEAEIRTKPDAYLTHGIAASKWKKFGRKEIFRQFIVDISSKIGSRYVQRAVVNLASEMAKICK